MVKWPASSDIRYIKRRAKILNDYIEFVCNSNHKSISEQQFFSKSNVEGFLQEQRGFYKNVAIIVTHLSETLKFIAKNKVDNFEGLMCLRDNFSLKEIPNIQQLISPAAASPQKRVRLEDVSFLRIDDFLKYIKIKNSERSSFDHRLIFMTLTGIRFQSSLNLKDNSSFLKRLCSKCQDIQICSQPTSDCFNRVKIFETKTTAHEFPLVPQASNSYKFLLSQPDNDSKYYSVISRSFNKTLKDRHNITSHALRKFLPNFLSDFSSSNNTGNWKGNAGLANMKKFYLQRDFKYISIFVMLRDSGFFC